MDGCNEARSGLGHNSTIASESLAEVRAPRGSPASSATEWPRIAGHAPSLLEKLGLSVQKDCLEVKPAEGSSSL